MVGFIEVGKVKFWGNDKGPVRAEEVENISSPLDSIMHLLRHFSEVSESWIEEMRGKNVAFKTIMNQVLMPGSKWNKGMGLVTPEDVIRFSRALLLDAVNKGQNLCWIGRGDLDFCYFPHQVTPDEKKKLLGRDGVFLGLAGLIPLAKIPRHVMVKQVFNRGGKVNVAKMDCPETDEVVVTLARKPNGIIQVFSAFPGILTPPIPKDSQAPEEREYNTYFWSRHALIE